MPHAARSSRCAPGRLRKLCSWNLPPGPASGAWATDSRRDGPGRGCAYVSGQEREGPSRREAWAGGREGVAATDSPRSRRSPVHPKPRTPNGGGGWKRTRPEARPRLARHGAFTDRDNSLIAVITDRAAVRRANAASNLRASQPAPWPGPGSASRPETGEFGGGGKLRQGQLDSDGRLRPRGWVAPEEGHRPDVPAALQVLPHDSLPRQRNPLRPRPPPRPRPQPGASKLRHAMQPLAWRGGRRPSLARDWPGSL